MEKELKFKKEWFEVLNRCDRTLRMDVIEAVFQYFFTGAEPDFSDDARVIAFGFIRAEIDETRRRRQQRLTRKNKSTEPSEPQPAVSLGTSTPEPAAPTPTESSPPTPEEAELLYNIIMQWNVSVRGTNIKPVDVKLPLDCDLFRPALEAMRRMSFRKVFDSIRKIRNSRSATSFRAFFSELKE